MEKSKLLEQYGQFQLERESLITMLQNLEQRMLQVKQQIIQCIQQEQTKTESIPAAS